MAAQSEPWRSAVKITKAFCDKRKGSRFAFLVVLREQLLQHFLSRVGCTVCPAEGVFAALERYADGPEGLKGLNFLIPRAAVARDYLPTALEQAGARCDVVTAYRTVQPDGLDRGRVSAMLAGGAADCIAFTSSSTVRNLAQLFDTHNLSEVLGGVAIACIGDITASTAGEYGLRTDILPDEFTVPALARAIAEHFRPQNAER